MKEEKWWIVYDELAKQLAEFYNRHRDNAGTILFTELNKSPSFLDLNPWLAKFKKQYGVESIDPIHIFASINGNKLSDENRLKRIQTLFEILHSSYKVKAIDFEGCPTPIIIRLISVRQSKIQNEIWATFYTISQTKQNQLPPSFNSYLRWYGVGFESFTLFLFWIKSDQYLPLDKNTRSFLMASKMIERVPKDFRNYRRMLVPFRAQNGQYPHNEKYLKNGLLREIAHIAYLVMNGNKEFKMTFHLLNFYEQFRADTYKSEDEIKILSEIGFKIIALQTHPNCNRTYLNILSHNEELFYFEKAFEINADKNEVTYEAYKNPALYGNGESVKINVTAVVGKNGSGKSSLIELLFRTINAVSYKHRTKLKTENLEPIKDLHVSLYYVLNGDLFQLEIAQESILLHTYQFSKTKFIKTSTRDFEYTDFENFFYSVAINYSHYSLNAHQIGSWINGLFHKNDGYQTPLVINPMRTNGDIKINIENQLARARFLANLFDVTDENGPDLSQITENQKAIKIKFKLNTEKAKFLWWKQTDKNKSFPIKFESLKNKAHLFKEVLSVFEFPRNFSVGSDPIKTLAKNYILQKIVRIAIIYKHYNIFDQKTVSFYSKNKTAGENKAKFRNYLMALKSDTSHITYKLKQAIHFLKFEDLIPKQTEFEFIISDQRDVYQNFKSNVDDLPILELLPPSFYKAKIIVIDKEKKEESDFDRLSSGEKQHVYSVHSILYHLKNLDSVSTAQSKLLSYSHVNFLLDEIELYYHPEMQRRYLGYLLDMIDKLSFQQITHINICLVTHSPYILSDIPNEFTLKLVKGKSDDRDLKSFGANVYDLLADGFFMEDGFIGNVAQSHIKNILDYLNQKDYDKTKHQGYQRIINLIGDEIIAAKLNKMMDAKEVNEEQSLEYKLKKLELKKASIEAEINKLKK